MKYESAKTPRGNVGVSYRSQAEADAQAAAMDVGGNRYCYNCFGCSRCSRCSGCSGCSRCSGCSDCSDCSRCSGCSDCSGCSGVLGWRGPEVAKLVALNGLRWPVAVSATHMQIGCENHTHAGWRRFGSKRIALMDGEALAFWTEHKPRLLALCELRASMEGGK